jgi:hypothetical protein
MTETRGSEKFETLLAAYGADISRWPSERAAGAREALLRDPGFRRAWEAERPFDAKLTAHRDGLAAALAASGAAGRVKRRTLAAVRPPLAGLDWRRIAAAMLVAAVLGGAMDIALIEQTPEEAEVVMLDPLAALDDTGLE